MLDLPRGRFAFSELVASSTASMTNARRIEEEKRQGAFRLAQALFHDIDVYDTFAWKVLGFSSVADWVTGTQQKVVNEAYGEGFELDVIRKGYVEKRLGNVVQDEAPAAPKAKAPRKEKAAPKAQMTPTKEKRAKKRKGD